MFNMPSNGPLTNIILTINNTNNTSNDGTFTTRNLRNVYRGRNRFTRQRSMNRIYRRRVRRVRPNVSNNNVRTLNQIINLPQQQITNDSLIDQFFNGSPFI
ncbi:unnamed protein product [Rhizophagus irregularis]|uniref:Uncharacterized protein n=1 Tax=Rhizophagus irregularis TaxID=588596 RepID=A0A916EFH4_9GLOM|nr:unnamed protein product [Rhizophagus irregularis]